MNLTFRSWLFKQTERQDQIGKLARAMAKLDASQVQLQQKRDEHKKWANIVTRHGKPEHVLAFNQAWREYQLASQV